MQDAPDMASAYQALQHSERLLYNIFKHLPIGIELYNMDGVLIDLNDKELEMFHVEKKEDILGINIFENPIFPKEMKERLKKNEDADFTFRYDFSKVGSYYQNSQKEAKIDLMTKVTTLYDNEHQPINYLLINADKTETTVAYNKIQEFEEFFELVGDYAKVGYAHFNVLTGHGYAQKSWYDNIGEEDETPLSEIFSASRHFHPDDRALLIQFLDDVRKGLTVKLSKEMRIYREDGTCTWTYVHLLVRKYAPQDQIIEIISINYDITELKRTEEMLVKARDKAEASDRLKSAFLANMSHEIRTPLNAIIGFSNILASTEEEQEKQEYINIIESNNTLLLQLISDILDLSKIEAGTLEFSYSNIDLNDMIKEVENITKCRMEGSGVQLIAETPLSSCFIRTEKNRLMQVINNFLTNAIKFTQKGSITFGYEIRDKMLYFHVTDTGCGIPANKKDSIFGRFVKLNSFAQGTGLGLSICRTIIEHMNGTIGVESEEGKGSTFWFTIPYQPARLSEKKAEEFQPITVQKDKLTILIAEDNESNYRLFQSILRKEYSLIHAWDGQEAIEKFKEHRPQIILMDINMPRMDGYEATKEIRKLSADVPIIAITAFAYASDEQRVLENGFDGYMSKPINAPLLKQQIASILQKRIIFL